MIQSSAAKLTYSIEAHLMLIPKTVLHLTRVRELDETTIKKAIPAMCVDLVAAKLPAVRAMVEQMPTFQKPFQDLSVRVWQRHLVASSIGMSAVGAPGPGVRITNR